MSLSTNVTDLATRVATEIKANKTLLNGNAADNSALTTTAKTNLVAAINEVAAASAGAAGIDDATITTTSTWSSSKTNSSINTAVATKPSINDAAAQTTTVWSGSKTDSEIGTRVSALVDAAPGTLDTLNELAAALGDDPNFATTINTALGNRVRYDAAQTLTGPQQVQARANIDAASATDVGPTAPATSYVASFNAGLL